jgi:hypothetical protein
MPAGVVADEPAPPDVQPAQTATATIANAAPASQAFARDLAAQTFMP